MQYLLTKEEFEKLERVEVGQIVVNKNELQKLCELAANHVPVDRDWDINDKSPWGCTGGYCDECPSQNLCTKPKDYSK